MTNSQCNKNIVSTLTELIKKAQDAKKAFANIASNGIANSQTSVEVFSEIVFIDIPKILNKIELFWDMKNAFQEPTEQSE